MTTRLETNEFSSRDLTTALNYLEQVAPSAAGAQAVKIKQKVLALAEHINWESHADWRAGASVAEIISSLPIEILGSGDIEKIQSWLSKVKDATWLGMAFAEKLLPRLLENKESDKALNLFSSLTMKSNGDAIGDDARAILDNYHLQQLIQSSAHKLGEQCGLPAVEMMVVRLKEYIGSVDNDKYSYIWRSAIENHEQDVRDDETRYLIVDALRDISLGAINRGNDEANQVATLLLGSNYQTIARVGIYICSENYIKLRSVFWAKADNEWFTKLPYWHEIYWFVKKSFNQFSLNDRAAFLDIVSAQKPVDSSAPADESANRYKRDVLHAAHGQGDPEVDSLYQALVASLGPVREHPDFHIYTSAASWSGDKSPVTPDEILKMSDSELIKFCKEFLPEPIRFDSGYSFTGVAHAITTAVRTSEGGFTGRLAIFNDLDRTYQHGLLRGLEERWTQDKRAIAWSELQTFIKTLVLDVSFVLELSAEDSDTWKPNIFWVISDIASLMKASSSKESPIDRHLLSENLEVTKLLLHILPRLPATLVDDAVFKVINSPRGKCLEAYIQLSLALRRIDNADHIAANETWVEIGGVFESELEFAELGENAEFSVLAGIYCSNFHFINAEWTESNFHRIFPQNHEIAWNCAMQGFAHQKYVYDWLYSKLLTQGHLEKILHTETLPKDVGKKALQFLSIGYLNGYLELETTRLLNNIISRANEEHLSHIVWFLWTMRNKEATSPHADKILAFLALVVEQLKMAQQDYTKLKSQLTQLMVFVDTLTPQLTSMFEYVAPYAQANWHGYILLENLARLAKIYPLQVTSILIAALDGFIPDYRKEDAIHIVTSLSEVGERESAMAICIAYAEKGSQLLKPLYEELRAHPKLV